MKNQESILNFLYKAAAFMAMLPITVSAQTNSPGQALLFNGSSQDVAVQSQAALDPFPMTAMCWFKTTSTNEASLVNKYYAASFNGYQIFIQDGNLTAWYITGSGVTFTPNVALTGGPVNDGNWHHAALSVDASGGRLYLDGALVSSEAWGGTPGATTTTQPLYLGYYPGITTPGVGGYYSGELDEISLWSVALYQSQIQTYRNRSVAGTEPNLVAYWRLDEGSGSTTTDNSGNGNIGTLENSPAWTNSDAPVGIVPPTGFSQNWNQVSVSGANSVAVASSADGIKLVYVNDEHTSGASTSTNGGTSWQPSPLPLGFWDNVVSSADGTIVVASQSAGFDTNIYESLDSGTTWEPITNLDASKWCLACSANGSTIIAASQATAIIAVSTNSGSTWVSNSFSGLYWHHLTCSSDGTHMTAVASLANIYYSTDSGATWHASTMQNDTGYYWGGIAASADGSKLITGGGVLGSNPLYRSTDFGVTWQILPSTPSNYWFSFASSADGSKLIACSTNAVYVSVDSGMTWQSTLPVGYAVAAMSADGTRTDVLASQYFYSSWSAPTLGFTSINGNNFLLSWPNPSTGFNLQQSATLDAGGWTNTPIRPNVVSSQNQVTVTNTGNTFFRLEFP